MPYTNYAYSNRKPERRGVYSRSPGFNPRNNIAGIKLWLDGSDTSTLTTAYQNLTSTVTGTSGLSALVCSGDESLNVFASMTVRISGTDIYTVQSVATSVGVTTITVVGTLSTNYTASALAVFKDSQESDKSGNNNNATQAAATSQPIYYPSAFSSKSGLIYNGGAQALTVNSSSSINNIFGAGGCFLGVCTINGAGGGGNGRIWDKIQNNVLINTVSGNGILIFNQTFSGTSGQWKMTNPDLLYTTKSIIMITYDSSSVSNTPSIYVNSITPKALTVVTTPVGTATSDAGSALTIGNRAALDRGMGGFDAVRIFYNIIPTAAQISMLFNYYASIYGIILT